MGSAFIKLSGFFYTGDLQSTTRDNETKTAFLRISDIEEICNVPPRGARQQVKDDKRKSSIVTEKEYKANPDLHGTRYYKDSGDNYWKFHDTVIVSIGISHEDHSNYRRNYQMALIDTSASQVVKQIDQAIVDFEVRKAVAIRDAKAKKSE